MTPASGITILDGGTGRELKRSGAPFRQPEWSALALIEAPVFVSRVHQSYVDAGASVITTNSYALVPFHIGEERFARDGERLARLAGSLAREVADAAPDHRVQVAGSLPPVCGSYRADWFDPTFARPILKVLVAGLAPSVDLWLAETLSTVAEAELVREVLDADARPLWLSFTLKDPPIDGGRARLRSGESVESAVKAALRLNASAVLFNCSQPEVMGAAIDEALGTLRIADAARATGSQVRVGIYANAFLPQPADAKANATLTEIRTDLTPQGYCGWAKDWVRRGATIVGGCCGIGPEHIHELSKRLD